MDSELTLKAYTRKQFLIGSGVTAVSVLCGRSLTRAQPASTPVPAATLELADNVPDFPEHHPQFDRARVKRFVIAGHVNLPAVKAMLTEEPNLINGAIDWGNGDFETALGGAEFQLRGKPFRQTPLNDDDVLLRAGDRGVQ